MNGQDVSQEGHETKHIKYSFEMNSNAAAAHGGSSWFYDKLFRDYPELYNWMFNDRLTKNTAVFEFMDAHDLEKGVTYEYIFKFITKNEDKHVWWML